MKLLLLLACVVLVACGGSRTAPEAAVPDAAPAGPIEGNYEYQANLPGQLVKGTLRVLGDTMLVEQTADYCLPVQGSRDPLAIWYSCKGGGRFEQLTLRLDRRNPAQFSKWSASFRVQKRRQVCAEYAIQQGRQVCVRQTTETYEDTESSRGNLQVRRTP